MAREQRTSTQVSSQTPLTQAQKIPPEVHNQLLKEFVPVVKETALAGQELLRNYQALEKSSETYATCLENLAKSTQGADVKSQEYGKELHVIIQEYKKYVDYHKECIKELTGIVAKTTIYSTEEKEKLKAMFASYQKEEKDIIKAQKKGLKQQSEVDAFYDTSARQFLRQQELRYRFFLDKHKRWFTKYWDLLEKIQGERGVTLPNGHVTVVAEVAAVVPPEVKEEEHPITNGLVLPATPVVVPSEHVEEVRPAMVPVAAEIHENGAANDDPPFLHTGNSSPRSSISSMDKIPSRRGTNENIPGVMLIHNERRPYQDHHHTTSQFENKFAEVPVAAPIPAPVTTTSAAVQAELPTPLPREEIRKEQPLPVIEQAPPPTRKYEYRGPIIMPAPVPRTREPEIIKPREAPLVVPRTVDAPVYVQPKTNNYYAPPPERPHYHVDAEYNPSVSPAHRPVSQNFAKPAQEQLVVPSMFNASDYGRTLTVTQDFNATSGEQMTVNRGDRVILIKSGSRGWIFIQDQATQRTGWIPAPFVSY